MTMNSFKEIIGIFPSHPWLGQRLGKSASVIGNMAMRNSIPAKYFLAIVKAAKEIGRDDVTCDLLSELADKSGDG